VADSSILDAYLKNEAALKCFLRRYVVRREDAEDLAQEAFLRAFAAEAVNPISAAKAFLFTTARNLALNERAKMANATSVALEDFAERSVIVDAAQANPETQMDAKERVRMLAQAVATLPPQCSRVFLLRKVHGLSYKEIADRLGISVSTAEKHAALGLLRCSEYLRNRGADVGTAAQVPATPESGRPVARVSKLDVKRQEKARHVR
jgi:RNA polymerase sigma-70 factor (ECF subfamily)